MKGLLIKDFYTSRKTIWAYLLMIGVFAVASSANGVIFALFYAIMIPINLIAIDERDRFDNLLPTMPVGGVALVLDKYIASWCMILLDVVIYLVRSLFPNSQFNLPMVLVGVGLCLISQAISLPLIYRFGVERGRIIYMAAIIGQAALLGVLGAVWEDYLVTIIAPWLSVSVMLVAGIGLSVGSIFVSGKVYEARITA